MATLVDPGFPTLLNVTKRLAPNGSVETDIAEVLTKELDILEDIPWVEGNLPTGHRITSRTGLPSPKWRRLNQGIDPSKSETAQFDESCGMLEDFSKVDKALANLNGNSAAWRMTEDRAFLESFSQELARSIFYESTAVNAERIHGLSARYAATTGYTSSSFVLGKGTRSGANCESIWLISWEPTKVFGIYPKGSQAGIQHKDLGEILARDASGKEFLALASHYKLDPGLAVKDYRFAVRLQYDPDDTAGGFGDTGKGVILGMQDALETVQTVLPSARFYMSRRAKRLFNAQMANSTVNLLEYVQLGGKRVDAFMGVPIRRTDALVPESALA